MKLKLSQVWKNEVEKNQKLTNQEKDELYDNILNAMHQGKMQLSLKYLDNKQVTARQWLESEHDIKCSETTSLADIFHPEIYAYWGSLLEKN